VSILLVYLGLGKSIYQFKPRHFLPNLGIVTEIYRVGLSQTVRASSASLSLAIANNVAASFGVVALAVLGVIFKVNMLVFAFCMGIGQGMLPLVGYNFGAHKKERVSEVVVKAGLTSFTWGALCWVVVTLFPAQIMSVFGTNPDFLAAGTAALRIFALGFFAVGVQNNLSFFFQGIGRGIHSLVVASSRNIIFLVPCLLTLPRLFGLTGLWVAYPVADALSLVLTLTWMVATFRSLKIPLRLRSGSPTA
jgi:Na+-driven multidrug efflux pump